MIVAVGRTGVWAQLAGDNGETIKEIKVTAQKREQTIRDTPLSVSAVSGDDIQKKAQGSIGAVPRSVPGGEVQGLAQGVQIYIRGVGSSIDPTFAASSIALMVDGAEGKGRE